MEDYTKWSIGIGVLFIGAGLIVTLAKPGLSPQAFWVVRVIVALGAGFVAAGILGNIEITGRAELPIKAGGPIAVTVLVYVWNPPGVVRARMAKRKTG